MAYNTWELEPDSNLHRLYSFGDRKSNKNCTAFVSTLSHRPLTFEESSTQAKIFLDSFCNIMFMPGDWHTGMNMLKSIYKVFWTDILSPMKTFLGWKQISKDVCVCYFQAARLVRYMHNVTSMYLMQCYVSSMFSDISDLMQNKCEADVICRVAVLYCSWILKQIKSSNKHLRLFAHFMSMSGNFLEFVQAYRCQHSIIIESGYSWFAPRWKLLGQCKYLGAYHKQLDCLLKMNQYF